MQLSTQALSQQRPDVDGPLPRTFGRLTLLKLLARGGMGEVYLASSGGIEGAERACVLKVIRREHASDPSFVARFLDEARVQSQLQHPGVAQILEAASGEDGQPYVVIEHVEGRSLAEVRSRAQQLRTSVSWAEGVAVGIAIAEALTHVHERFDSRGKPLSIVHRDLSPQNVMVAFAGEVKLIDFGTARATNRRCHTVSGVVYAKPGYVAPEVANGVTGDALVDIYALGVILWEICAGRRFLVGDSGEHLEAVAANRKPLPKIADEIGAPAGLDDVLAKLTAFDRAARMSSARAALTDLTKLLSDAPALSNGERGVRPRIASMLAQLYPSEPGRMRGEFARLVRDAQAKKADHPTPGARPTAMTAPPKGPGPKKAGEGVIEGTQYRRVRTLGQGAGGVVVEAVHVELGRRAAVKLLSPEEATRDEAMARFRREARAMSRVTHPAVPKLYDFGRLDDGGAFLAMELWEGDTIEKVLAREPSMALGTALRIARDAARALAAVHAQGFVHRDVKPSNLVLTAKNEVKLLDFGLACKKDGDDEDLAKTGVFGTPEYMAPEQTDGPVDERADVYALGSVLYEMLTGRHPFAAPSQIEIIDLKKKKLPEAPSDRVPARKLPRAIDKLVLKALARKPEHRYVSAHAFADAIEEVARSLGTEAKRRRRRALGGFSVVMTTALAILGLYGERAVRHGSIPTPMELVAKLHPSPKSAPIVVVTAPEVQAAPTLSTVAPEVAAPAPAEDKAIDQKPIAAGDVRSLRGRTRRAVAHHQWDDAKRFAEAWLAVEDAVEPRLVIARSLADSGDKNGAKDALNETIAAFPTCDEARSLLNEIDPGSSGKKHARTARADRLVSAKASSKTAARGA